MNLKINMPKEVEKALSILNDNGYSSYIVGGCVRDSILNVEPTDWDITASALPMQIIECFKNYKTIETGLKHGTVTVIINNMHLEITTFRIDGEYKDNRRPDNVFFTNNISLDLERRDFTINAMAYNDKDRIIDLNGGVEDIKYKQIKCVGNPDRRFNEDGLRILRALRFASVLDFDIEEETSKSIHRNKELLKKISAERITAEFNKLILGVNFFNILNDYKDVIEVFIPEINHINYEQWQHSLNAMKNVQDDLVIKLALFLHHIGKCNYECDENKDEANLISSYYANNVLKRLKYDNDTICETVTIIKNIDAEIYPTDKSVKMWLNKLEKNDFLKLLKAKKSHNYSQNSVCDVDNHIKIEDKIENIVNKIINQNECYNLKTLAVNGSDLVKAGIGQGEIIGKILNELLNLVIDEKLENDKNKLLTYVKSEFIN